MNQSLRNRPAQENWAANPGIPIAGTRVDTNLYFHTNGWGERAPLHLTHGTDADWEDFSVQWDGLLRVYQPMRFATISDDGSRMWIDLDGNRRFAPVDYEFIDNPWGQGQGWTTGPASTKVATGTYQLRLQYEDGNGDNRLVLVGVPAE